MFTRGKMGQSFGASLPSPFYALWPWPWHPSPPPHPHCSPAFPPASPPHQLFPSHTPPQGPLTKSQFACGQRRLLLLARPSLSDWAFSAVPPPSQPSIPFPLPFHSTTFFVVHPLHPPTKMGNTRSALGDLHLFSKGGVFTSEQLDEYQDCTFFTKKDILRLYKRFHALNPEKVPSNMQGNQVAIVKLTFEEVGRMPELKENPFRRRICEVFSEDGCGNLTFDDFLDMFSVFSEMAPLQLKLKYAFRIYDFDGDEFLGREDLRQMIDALTRKEMSDEEVEFIIDRIIEEADLDGDKRISQAEFEHVVSRSPDFVRTFHIRI